MVVSRGQDALSYLEREPIEIFVVELPGHEGDDRMALLSALQQRALPSALAIVAVTRSETSDLRTRARAAGVIDFLSKPIEPVEVACKVHSLRRLQVLSQSRKDLRLEPTQCSNIVDSIAEGISTIDAEGRVNFLNPTAAEMFGYTIDEAMGHLVTDFVPDDHWKRRLRDVIARVRRGNVDRTEFLVRRKDGTQMWITATGTPLYEAGRYVGAVVSFRDITLRRNTEEALRQSEQRLGLAIVVANLGIWDWDLVTDTAYLSPEYLRMVSGQETEIRSARAWFEHLVHPDDRAQVMPQMQKHLKGETPQSIIEFRAMTAAGGFIWLRGIGRVVSRDHTGTPLRMIGVVIDINEQKRTEELLRTAIVTRNNILAIAAHDLKNPLTAIHLSAELLTERPPERDRRKNRPQLEVIRRSAAHMHRLIANVLDASTIEAGTFTLNYASEELGPLIRELVEECAALAARKSIELVYEVPTDLPEIWCDGTRLREVLSNLIGNAVKFVPEHGTVWLRVWAQGGDVHFEVSDNGPGIPEHSLAHLFDRYWQGDGAGRSGSGLGLFISKGIVDAHHGHMFVVSEVGVGTTFHFTIPIRPHAEQLLETVH
jgi:two-component system, sensor histidine kinase and response regulator